MLLIPVLIDNEAFEFGFKHKWQFNNIKECVHRKAPWNATQRLNASWNATQYNTASLLYSPINDVTIWGWAKPSSSSAIKKTTQRGNEHASNSCAHR
jgi:hypothetical protein